MLIGPTSYNAALASHPRLAYSNSQLTLAGYLDMAWSILFLAVLIFAFRGYFLALPGVIGRCLGFILGYFAAWQYREDLAHWISSQFNWPIHPLALEGFAGISLFFVTLFITVVMTKWIMQGLGVIIPPLAPIFKSQALSSRIAGAIGNSALAVALVMLGLWGYGLVKPNSSPDTLQITANQFGNFLFANAMEHYQLSQTTTDGKTTSRKGVAVISDGNKSLRIETEHTESNTTPNALQQLLNNDSVQEQIQSSLNNPEMLKMAEDLIRENPEALQQVLDKPETQQLIEQLQQQQ